MTDHNRAPFDLGGKIALITGASRGIGAEMAKLFAAYGAHVVISSRKGPDCELVAEEIRAAGGSAEARACHIGDLEQIAALEARLKEDHGRLDILVNNAAANPYFGPIGETPPDAFMKIMEVNLRGYFYMSVAGARLMENGGAILNVASIGGVTPGLFQGAYSISKAAVISMTKAMAQEWGARGIRVNALLPGLTDTKFASVLVNTAQIRDKVLERVPLGRVAQPSEMAGAALFLCSAAGSYATGSIVTVDGGFLST